MKNNKNYIFAKVLGLGLFMSFSIGQTTLFAQDVATEEEHVDVATRRQVKNDAPTYQMKEISGIVLDAATKEPISGVRIQALDDVRYTGMTGEDGRYKFSVPYFVTALFVSTPDYNSLQVSLKDGEQTIKLYSSVFSSFYKDGTDVITNKAATIKNSSSVSVESEMENLLEGNVRTISRGGIPGLGANVMINGISSLNTTSQPLVVVDGVIWDMQYDRSMIHDGYYNNLLNTIDVEDIESVKVLNSGTSIYGAKGANGVIEITTKRGRERATRIQARIYGGIESTPNTIDVMNGSQYRNYMSEILGTYKSEAGADPMKTLYRIYNQNFMKEDPSYTFYDVYHNNTDWQKDLYKSAFTQNYKINVQGGDDIALYGLSLGYTQSNATAKENDFNRLNIRFNTDINVFRDVFASFDLAYTNTNRNMRDNGWAQDYSQANISSPNVLGTILPSMISKYNYIVYWDPASSANRVIQDPNVFSGKNWNDANNPYKFGVNYGTDALANPYWILLNGDGDNKNYQEQTQFMLNFNPRYELNKYWTIGDRFSYVMNRSSEKYYLPMDGVPHKSVEGLGTIYSSIKSQSANEDIIANNLYASFKKNFGEHNLNAMAGFRLNSYSFSNSWISGYNNGNDKMPNLSYSLQYLTYGGTNDNWMDLSYYLTASYNYLNRYFVNATLTSQASSRFGKETSEGLKLFGVKWGMFPAVQAAWLVSSEPWFNAPAVNYLKVFGGYEESGNDNIDYYASRTYFANTKFFQKATALTLENISNSSIQWETTRRFNVGLETALLNNRINLGVNVFWSTTSNLLTLQNLSYVTGLSQMWSNNGEMTNKGVNVNVSGIVLNAKNFKWEVGMSLGHYKNEITKLPSTSYIDLYALDANGNKDFSSKKTIKGYTSSIYGENNILTAVGKSAGVFYGFKTQGVFQSNAEAAQAGNGTYLKYPTGYRGDPYRYFKGGDVHFVDQNGDGWISEADMVEIGDPNPDLYGNIYTKMNWKHFTLDVNFKYSIGNDVFNYQRSQLEAGNNLWNQTTTICNRWSYDGQVTNTPRAVLFGSDEWVNNERFSDRWIENGSYLKLKKVRLTYDMPLSLSWLQGLTIWGEANNLVTFTKYHGLDPEVSCGNGVLYQGIDAGWLPSYRSFNLGITINL